MIKHMEKQRRQKKTTHFKPLCLIILGLLIINLIGISLISAFEFDNVQRIKETKGWDNYPDLEVQNIFGLGKILWSGSLKHNTDKCGADCSARTDITLHEEGSLVDDIIFKTLQDDNVTWIEQDIESYQLMLETEVTQTEVPEYITECEEVYNEANNSYSNICEQILDGYTLEDTPQWREYELGEILPVGDYTLKLVGEKEASRTVDWIYKTQGEWLNEWAIWNATFAEGLQNFWNFNEGTGTTAADFQGIADITVADSWTVSGIISNGFLLTGTQGADTGVNLLNINGTKGEITLNFWFNSTGIAADDYIISVNNPGGIGRLDLKTNGGGTGWDFVLQDDIGNQVPTGVILPSQYQMVTLRINSSFADIYINGVFNDSDSLSNFAHHDSTMHVWEKSGGANDFVAGGFDEMSIYNRMVPASELEGLYNNGAALTAQGLLSVTLNAPVDNFNSSISAILFNATQPGAVISANASLFHNASGAFVLNQTNLSISPESNNTLFNVSFSDGNYLWNIQFCSSTGDCAFATENRTFSVDVGSPTINVFSPIGLRDIAKLNTNELLNWTVEDINLDMCWFEYNSINTTVGCSSGVNNATNFTLLEDKFNLTFYANDTSGNENSSFIEWNYKILVNNETFNNSVFETAFETYSINVTANSSLTSANLIWDGTTFAGTQSGNVWSKSIDIPTDANVNKSFHWSFSYLTDTINSTENSILISHTNFSLCGLTAGNIPFINFTFKNETTSLESTNATMNTAFIYWSGSGTVNKTLAFSNVTENAEYSFCSTPADKTLNLDYLTNYNNAESQQRSFTEARTLSNLSFERILYLLPSSLGIFTTFRTEDTISNILNTVSGTITRVIGGSTIQVTSGLTDSSGIVVFFLNPDATYQGSFSKAGFLTNTFTFVPITDIRVVVMGSTAVTTNGTEISLNTQYQTFPINSSLVNNTDVLFAFNVTSNEDITLISMNITNATGSQIGFQSNAGQGFISETINTGNNSKITGRFILQTSNETIEFVRVWIVGNEFIGDYSLFKQLDLFLDYEFSDFSRLFIIIAVIFGLMIFLTAGQITDTSESQIGVLVILVWIFSVVGWLVNPLVVAETGLAQFSRQYGIAILTTAGASFFIIRRLLIRRI